MKLKPILLYLFLIALTPARAQVLVGPVIGPQISWVAFDDKDSKALYKQKPVYGFHAGADLSFRVNKRFFLHTAFLYSMKGKHLTGNADPLYRNKATYHYIDMPLAYTAEFITKAGKGKQFKWYLGLGPNVSYLLKGKGFLENTDLSEILVNRVNYKMAFDKEEGQVSDNDMLVPEANRLQLGLNISSGLVFEPLGLHKVMITMRYEFGHSFYSRIGKGTIPRVTAYEEDLRVRNQGVRISVAYLIDLKTEDRKRGKSTSRKKTFNR